MHHIFMKPTTEQIREIADYLECGMRCFFHLETGEIRTLLNPDNWPGADDDLWDDENGEIDEESDEFFEFSGYDTSESFELMAEFAANVDDEGLQAQLEHALDRSKPFRNFRAVIDASGKYREQWFAYRTMCYIQLVEEQIELNESCFDES